MVPNEDDDDVQPRESNGEEFECRICREEGSPSNPLLHPCACSGSIKWCHEQCILDWLKASGRNNQCETCGKSLTFQSLYHPNAPALLPLREIVGLLCKRSLRAFPKILHFGLIAFVWLVFAPLMSNAVFQVLRKSPTANNLTTTTLLLQFFAWEQGVWIIAAGVGFVFLIFTVVVFVHEFERGVFDLEIEQLRARAPQPPIVEQQRPRRGGDVRLPPPRLDHGGGDLDVGDVRPPRLDQDVVDVGGGDVRPPPPRLDFNHGDIHPFPPRFDFDHDGILDDQEEDEEEEFQQPVLDFPPNEDDNPDGAAENWFGLAGTIYVIIFNFFLAVVLAMSFKIFEGIGKKVLLHGAGMKPPVFLCRVKPEHFWDVAQCFTDEIVVAEQHVQVLSFELLALCLGVCSEIFFFFILSWGCRKTRRVGVKLFPALSSVWRNVAYFLESVMRVQKVLCMFLFKMAIFPLFLGVLIEWSVRPAIDFSFQERMLFAAEFPHLCLLMLWFAGLSHTLLVSVNVILVRDILHPDVLDGIIKLRNPHENQFLPILVEPGLQQLKRMGITSCIYIFLVLMFITLPIRILIMSGSPLLPIPNLYIHFVSIRLELPISLAVFHVSSLTLLEKYKPWIVLAQNQFFSFYCHALGLTSYLLPQPRNEQEYAAAMRQAMVHAAPLHWLDSRPRVSPDLLLPRTQPTWVSFRVGLLLLLAWFHWWITCFGLIAVPYSVGMFVGWRDVRLYFVACLFLEYGLNAINVKHTLQVLLQSYKYFSALVLLVLLVAPLLFGVFLYLCFRSTEADFQVEKYVNAPSDVHRLVEFFSSLLRGQTLLRVWVTGLPLLIALSFQNFWTEAAKSLRKFAIFVTVVLFLFFVSAYVGIWVWWVNQSQQYPPLIFARLVLLLLILCLALAFALNENWKVLHDDLKNEKYLIGKRLVNFQS